MTHDDKQWMFCGNNRLKCMAMLSGAVLMILLLFWGFQQSALGALDSRLRTVESRQAAVMANQETMIDALRRIEAKLDARQAAKTP